jgi:hypothetical protein
MFYCSREATVKMATEPVDQAAIETERLLAAMRELGLSPRVAGDMARRYAPARLWRMLRQTRYALRMGLASNPAGWFVASVRDNWPAPAGYDDWAELEPAERRAALNESWGVCPRCGRRPCHCPVEPAHAAGGVEGDEQDDGDGNGGCAAT